MNPLTAYADESLWKEDWKREYKYGVILFVPPESVRSFVDGLRKTYDLDSFNTCTAHISLTMPLKGPLTKDQLKKISLNLKDFDSFNVTYGPVINFLPVAPGVVFKINEQELFNNLYKQIESTSNVEFYTRKWPFKAHLTIAEFLDDHTTKDLTEELNNSLPKEKLYGNFVCDKVSYMVPTQEFRFKEILTIPLGK